MNYAEDRLDRRARMMDVVKGDKIMDSYRLKGSLPCEKDKSKNGFLHTAADECIHRDPCYSDPAQEHVSWSKNSLVMDIQHAHEKIRTALHHPDLKEAILLSKVGHELAGRTLRDCGLCAHASFHYAMAWMCDVTDADRAGDYAQMAEFCGCPYIGIYSLLFYRSGGKFNDDFLSYSHTLKTSKNMPQDHGDDIGFSFSLFDNSLHGTHCGCGLNPCGQTEFYIPWEMESSHIYQNIIEAFVLFEEHRQCSQTLSASNVLEYIAVHEKTYTDVNAKGFQDNKRFYVNSFHDTTDVSLKNERFDCLRFWEKIGYDRRIHGSFHPSNEENVVQEDIIVCMHSGMAHFATTLPPILQLLLLKLLYISGGPYLYLACEAVPHISALFPRSSKLSLFMMERYKSHWAYFCLIRYIVLGERMKKHRRAQIPYHIPIWDVVHHLDSRYFNEEGFFEYLQNQLNWSLMRHPSIEPMKRNISPLFVVGDSHVISIGWQTIRISRGSEDGFRFIVPLPVTGLKAWHVREGTKFFTNYTLHKVLERLPTSCRTIIFSAGEIDCREGIGGERLEGYEDSCTEEVIRTVKEYVMALEVLSHTYNLQILVMPVAPHAKRSEKNGRKLGRAMRRERMMFWNEVLKEECKAIHESKSSKIFLLDYEQKLRYPDRTSSVGFVLNQAYNADYTHMNSAFLSLMEEAVTQCGCCLRLL